jgi:TetR/AcrR family transcriptional regulator, transcriptional repressor for nem operon
MKTRTKILNSAQRLIQTRSFEGFSFQDIADEVGIRKASLYHHFDSKDAVAIAVLKRGADWVTGQLDATKELAPPERLERYFDLFHDLHGKAERMCPGGSFASVLGAVSPAVQRALHAFTKMHLDWLEGVVREGAALGAFEIGEQAPRDVALQIFSSVQGALLTGRLTADPGVLDAVATELRTYLRYTPKGREGGSKPA